MRVGTATCCVLCVEDRKLGVFGYRVHLSSVHGYEKGKRTCEWIGMNRQTSL